MRDIVKTMSAEGETDPDAGLASFMADARQVAGWQALLNTLDAFERGVLTAVAQGCRPWGARRVPGWRLCRSESTVARVRTALEKLKRAGILTRTEMGWCWRTNCWPHI